MNKHLKGLYGLSSLWLGFILLTIGGPVHGQPVRFLTWNAQSLTNSAETTSSLAARINSAALWLREYQADVVLLQELPDRQTAHLMAARLGEGYSVVVCSAFSSPSVVDPVPVQVAIISHLPSALSWAQTWDPIGTMVVDGGFAFALLRQGNKYLSVYSLMVREMPETGSPGVEAMQQLREQIAATANWKTNHPVAHIAGGSLNLRSMESAPFEENSLGLDWSTGFTSAFHDLSPEQRQTRRGFAPEPGQVFDDLLADGGAFVAPARTHWGISSDHAAVVVDWDFSPAVALLSPLSEETAQPAEPKPVESPLPQVAEAEALSVPSTGSENPTPKDPGNLGQQLFGLNLKWWVLGLLLASLFLWVLILRRTSRRTLVAKGLLALPDELDEVNGNGWPHAVTSHQAPRRLHPHLLAWLKDKFIGGLLVQRQDLIESHDDASERAEKIGQRVERVQEVLLKRIRQSEERVNDLEQELAQSQAENRELIQVNLAMAHRELEDARKKAGLKI